MRVSSSYEFFKKGLLLLPAQDVYGWNLRDRTSPEMVTQLAHLSARRGVPALKQHSDVDLIKAVAQRRDADAFGELFRRYKAQAFNLAYYIARNKETAEEAVQEGMLRVWSGADSFKVQEADKVKSWIMCIVARRAQVSGRRRRKEQDIMEQQVRGASASQLPQDASEHRELSEALCKALDDLPKDDRVMVSLYYGAGMSQEEISRNLSIAQTTVSFRVKKIVEHLRGRLASAGMASAGILPEAEQISEALCGRWPEPADFEERILSRLKEGSTHSTSNSLATTVPLWVAAGVLVASAFVYVPRFLNKDAGGNTTEVMSGATSNRDSGEQTLLRDSKIVSSPLNLMWNFAKERPTDLKPEFGTWAWKRGRDGVGAMVVPGDNNVLIPLPVDSRHDHWFIQIQLTAADPRAQIFTGAFWKTDHGYHNFKTWTRKVIAKRTTFTVETYGMGPYCATYFGGRLQALRFYESNTERKNLALHLGNVRVHWISFKAVGPEAIPLEMRDPETLPERYDLTLRTVDSLPKERN